MIKKLLQWLGGYRVKIIFDDGEVITTRAYLGKDCTVRTVIWSNRQIQLTSNGVVRGLWSNDLTKWETY